MVELLGITEDQPRRNADALLQGAYVQILGIDSRWQADPENKATLGPAHLRAFGEVLLHRQLEGAEVLAVLLANKAQVAVVTAVLQIRRYRHLRHAAR